jgi:TolA-binding protein
MKERDRLPEDLSAVARRGELSPAEARRFDVYLSASPITAWLHRLGYDYDALGAAEPGDQALLDRVVERAYERRMPVRARRTSLHLGAFIVAVLACSAAAALATAGVLHWTRTSGTHVGSAAPPSTEPARHSESDTSTPNASASRSDAPPAIASAVRETRHPSAGAVQQSPEAAASERRVANAVRQTASQMFSLANELRKAGRTSEAVAAYRRLQSEYPGATEASVSHVLMGRILMRHEGPASAHQEFERYLARHPRGNLAEEALSGSAAALRALGRGADERLALETLLSRFPSSIYAGAARERLDELD